MPDRKKTRRRELDTPAAIEIAIVGRRDITERGGRPVRALLAP